MPFCPNCSYEYIEGITICPDCGIALVDEDFFIKPQEWSEENWEVIYTSDKEYEVEMLKDNLESAGIAAAVLSQKDRNFPAPGDFSVVKLLVRKEDMKTALNFIGGIQDEESDPELD